MGTPVADDVSLHTESSDVPEGQIFRFLPLHLRQHMQRLTDLLDCPEVTLKKRFFNNYEGIMQESDKQYHLQHMRDRMHMQPLDCVLDPTDNERKFDTHVPVRFHKRKAWLIEEIKAKTTGSGTEKTELSRMLQGVITKIDMDPDARIMKLYRPGHIARTQKHKRTLAVFAKRLSQALLQSMPELLPDSYDETFFMSRILLHDYHKILLDATFAADVHDEDLGDTYADFSSAHPKKRLGVSIPPKPEDIDPSLAMFFITVSFHNLYEGSYLHGHHPHAVNTLHGDNDACKAVREFLTLGKPDFYRVMEATADTLDKSFCQRTLVGPSTNVKANDWLSFASNEFHPGCNQEVPTQELLMRYRIILTDSTLMNLDQCKEAASYLDTDTETGESCRKLKTTAMLTQQSKVFAELADLVTSGNVQ